MPLGAYRLNGLAKYQPIVSAIDTEAGIYFDQTATQYLRSSVTSTRAAGKYVTISFWARLEGFFTGSATYVSANTTDPPTNSATTLNLYITTDGNQMLRLYMYNNSLGSLTVDIRTQLRAMSPNTWNHVLFIVDSSSQANTKIYVNGIQQGVTYIALANQNIGLEQTRTLEVGADIRNNGNRLLGKIAQLWIDDTWVDPSTNLTKFYDDGFVDMGLDGTASGLSQPLMYFVGGVDDFYTNRGHGTNFTVGDFTANGTVVTSSTKPIDGETWAINRYGGYVPRFNNATISTTKAKFSQSIYMNNSNLDRGIYYTQFDNAALNASDYWTIEGFLYYDNGWTNSSRAMINGPAGAIYARSFSTLGTSVLEFNLGGVNWNGGTMTAGSWHHWAVVKDGTASNRIYVNGSLVSSRTNNILNPFTSNPVVNLWIGVSFPEYMDEMRISKVARYSGSSYTVPTGPFTNDSNTLLLLSFDGTNGSTQFTDDF